MTAIKKSTPSLSSLHVSQALTDMSLNIRPTAANGVNFVHHKVFPIAKSPKQADRYHVWNQGDFFRDNAEKRGPMSQAPYAYAEISSVPFFIETWALKTGYDDKMAANADEAVDLDGASLDLLKGNTMLTLEREFAAKALTTSVWATDLEGKASGPSTNEFLRFDASGGDFVKTMREARAMFRAKSGGINPNGLLIGDAVWDVVSEDSGLLEKIKYTQLGVMTEDLVARALDFKDVQVMSAYYNSAAQGLNAVYAPIHAKSLLLYYSPELEGISSGIRTMSAGKTFVWTGLPGANEQGERILRYQDPSLNAEIIELEKTADFKVTASTLGLYMFDAVS